MPAFRTEEEKQKKTVKFPNRLHPKAQVCHRLVERPYGGVGFRLDAIVQNLLPYRVLSVRTLHSVATTLLRCNFRLGKANFFAKLSELLLLLGR